MHSIDVVLIFFHILVLREYLFLTESRIPLKPVLGDGVLHFPLVLMNRLNKTEFIVTPIVGFCICSMFCCTFRFVPSSFAIILMGKRELVALLSLSFWCLVIVVRLFLAVPWVSLQFGIVVFPDHTHLLCMLFSYMVGSFYF